MAKQASDAYTLDLLDKPKRGRPRKPDAMTPAQRAREYRARQRAQKSGGVNIRDASRKFDASTIDPSAWYFPGTSEWHAQQALLGRSATPGAVP